jgi:PAS domain S-box-containing protein
METELSRVIDALPGLVWTALPDGQIDFLNRRWCDYTGRSIEEDTGWGWKSAIHPDDLPELLERWQSGLASGEPREMEARLRRFDGEYRSFLIRACPLTDDSGRLVKWCGMNTDIEDRKRSDEALHACWWLWEPARERQFSSIVDAIPALSSLMTPVGEVELVNRQLLKYFGATREEVKGRRIDHSVHPDDRAAVLARWNDWVNTGVPSDFEARLRRTDGIYRWFVTRGFPLPDMEGRIAFWYILQSDIDDRKRAEALLAGEKRLLEMVARGRAMAEVLEELCQFVERLDPACHCSVVLVDPSGSRLEHGAAPSLPKSFIDAINGRPVNADAGPSAMAAFLNEQVIAPDLASETRWAAYQWCPMAMAHGLRACWATPISSTSGKVLGALAIYYEEPRMPTTVDQDLIEQFTQIARIAVESAQNDTALRSSEARKTAILDSALDCIITIDHEGCITEFNPAAQRTFGYRREDVVGVPLANVIIPPSFRELHRSGLARHVSTGEARVIGKRVEMTAVRSDGSEFPVELAITRIPLDGPPSFTGYLRDITDRKQSEENLRRSEAFLAEAQHLSSTGSFSWRVATDEITWSEELHHIFESDRIAPVTLAAIGARFHPEDRWLLDEMADRARGAGHDLEYEFRLQMPDQSIKYLHMVAHGSRDQEDRLEYIGAIQDVTERRLSEEALGKVRSELAHVARVTSMGALTASIAHEVNQPLSGIITNASTCLRMLAAEPPNVDGARETARRTIRDGNRASDVITRLRALFERKSGAVESVDLNEATREVLALSSGELQSSRVILRPELSDEIAPVVGDRVQLQQVILNLLRNAADAMRSVDDRPRQLTIRTERDEDDHVRVSVRDAGVGFEPQGADRLFDAFYTTKSDGMGIGLSVSRSIIENHRGRLWATTNDGPGATFSFSIPRGSAGMTTADIDSSQTPSGAGAAHVMRSS